MSKIIKIAAVVSMFVAPLANAAHESPWLFPNYSATRRCCPSGPARPYRLADH
jgi:hypothetical protein